MSFMSAVRHSGQVRRDCPIEAMPVLIDNNGGLMKPVSDAPAGVAFGRFQVLPHRRELIADGEPVRLGGRAFDVLIALIEVRGAVLGKNALMARIWPDRIFEENALQAQIVALRRAFGADRDLIRTVSGRGYQFTGKIRALSESVGEQCAGLGPEAAEPATLPATNVPEPVSELIGRDDELAGIVNLIGAHRLVTLTGSGGIGKTRLAFAAAHRLLPHFADGVWLVQLSPLADPGLVPAAVAAAVGLELSGEASVQSVARALAGRRLLLVLDTCEHVIEVAASMAEAALGVGSELRIIATTREPLRAEGEWLYSVPPLAMPADDDEDKDEPLRYAAIRLFVERARAAAFPNFAPDRRLMAMIAAICRRLGGIPLAIELAAARAAVVGVEGVATRLDDRFNLLTGGWRTALPRHQTLRATLDWSYELLSQRECVILRRLGIFAGPFSLEGASAVAASAEISPSDVVDGLASLAAKSVVTVEAGGPVTRYRLLDTMRAFALEKLDESGEQQQVARRHAEYYRDLFERAETESETRPGPEWLEGYGWQIDNLRAALDWAFSSDGDPSTGVALTTAAIPLWIHLSLLEECRVRLKQALAAFDALAARDLRREMKLHAALGKCATNAAEMTAALTAALEIAQALGNVEYQMRALRGLYFVHASGSRYRIALTFAERFYKLAATGPDLSDRPVGDLCLGMSRHFLGDQPNARQYLDRALQGYVPTKRSSYIIRFRTDVAVSAHTFSARVLWLGGLPEQATQAVKRSIDQARAAKHVTSLCYALAYGACPVVFWIGDLSAAEDHIESLLDHSAKHRLTYWQELGISYKGVLAIRRGDPRTGLRLLRVESNEPARTIQARLRTLLFVGEMAEALGRIGQVTEGLAALEGAIKKAG